MYVTDKPIAAVVLGDDRFDRWHAEGECILKRLAFLALAVLLCGSGGFAVVAQNDPVTELVDGNTAFALNLYGVARQGTTGNLLFSPFSISQALAMTYAGAEGETAAQIAQTMQFTLDPSTLPMAFQMLDKDLVSRGTSGADRSRGYPPRSLQIANGLWGEQTFPFSPVFSNQLAEHYGAGLQPVDFLHDPAGARKKINNWIAKHTGNRIQNIVPEGVLTTDSRLVLANAVYFSGGWLFTFDENNTEDAEFTLLDGATTRVPFMQQQEHFSYAAGDGYQMVELPYAGSQFAFTVLLPDAGQFATIEQKLDSAALTTAIDQLESRDLILSLPKFEFDNSTSLATMLQALGMTDAFDPNTADFSGMLDADTPELLSIGDVLHEAFISVDEEGTEATAATAVIMEAGAVAPGDQPLDVRIDRPFIFLIRDTQTGTILFMGRMMNPAS